MNRWEIPVDRLIDLTLTLGSERVTAVLGLIGVTKDGDGAATRAVARIL